MGEGTPPPEPPEPKKSAAGRLKDYVFLAATSPETLLPVLGIVAIILLRDHLEAPVARGLSDGQVEIGNLDANIATALIITPQTKAN